MANPPKTEGICNACGSKLVIRDDDRPETVRHRLEVYHTETEALKGFYETLGKLRLVEGISPSKMQLVIFWRHWVIQYDLNQK